MVKRYRDLFKWGDPSIEEEIDPELKIIIEEKLDINIRDLDQLPGDHPVEEQISSSLDNEVIEQLHDIVGEKNVSLQTEDILKHAQGASYTDVLRFRRHEVENYPQAVIYPSTEDEITKIMELCHQKNIAIIPIGGLSSVTDGIAYPTLGIAVDLSRNYNNIVEINPTDSTVTVQAGMLGPELEEQLNNYTTSTAQHGYTCGHFPQSFEFSTVGGWVVTRGAGQESTGYGKIEDMVLGLRIITPTGLIKIPAYPAKALGPDLLQLVIGSEGSFGIVTEVVMKIRKVADTTLYAAFLFKSWKDGLEAVRSVMQGRMGKPFLFRLSDPEESDIYLKMSGLSGWKQWLIDKLGYKSGKRVLMLCSTSGTSRHANQVMKSIKNEVKHHNGRYVGSSPVREWLKDRYQTPYLRATLMDQNLIIDTLETAVTWDNIYHVWNKVRSVIKSRSNTITMVHLSHMYENGSNLYFIFITPSRSENPVKNYQEFQKKIIEAIREAGGSLSHHHGIGRLFAPYLENQIGERAYSILKSIKHELDPKNICNPGVLNFHTD